VRSVQQPSSVEHFTTTSGFPQPTPDRSRAYCGAGAVCQPLHRATALLVICSTPLRVHGEFLRSLGETDAGSRTLTRWVRICMFCTTSPMIRNR